MVLMWVFVAALAATLGALTFAALFALAGLDEEVERALSAALVGAGTLAIVAIAQTVIGALW